MSSFIWQAGGDFVKEENGKFSASLNTPEVAQAMTFMRTMMCDKVTQPGAINATTADVIPPSAPGKAACSSAGRTISRCSIKTPVKTTSK
jgi:multiple sugar transport system substrate-binding protein